MRQRCLKDWKYMPGDPTASRTRVAMWLRDAESDLALASVKRTRKIRYESVNRRDHKKALAMASETVAWAKALVAN